MSSQFDNIKQLYQVSYSLYGDSPASLLTPKGRNNLRFRAIDQFINKESFRILDYGCGLGYLLDYLSLNAKQFEYVGVDLLPDFVNACKLKYPQHKFPNASFRTIGPEECINESFDIIFSSGVFNIRTHPEVVQSKAYAFKRLEELYRLANEAMVCDFLSAYVDYQQESAQHFSASEIADFCIHKLGRRFTIRHDLLPYEMTAIIWKDSAIKRPENIFRVDS